MRSDNSWRPRRLALKVLQLQTQQTSPVVRVLGLSYERGGNRQLNTAIHRIAVTRGRCHPETKDYLARKRAEGKTQREAIRCLKRHLARRIWHLLQPPHPDLETTPATSNS